MKQVFNVIKQLRGESSTNAKKEILVHHKNNELLQKVLFYTYNPFLKYGMSEKILTEQLKNMSFIHSENENIDIFQLLDKLASSNINNDLREEIAETLMKIKDNEIFELYKCILLKDLKIGVNVSTINKVWKSLVPKFEIQLAKGFKDVSLKDNEYIYITEKLDGIRCVMIKSGDSVKFFTRQGKEINGLFEIEKEIMEIFKDKDIVLDGELLAINYENLNSGDLYRKTVKIVNKKDGEKTGVHYCVFDVLSLEEFKQKTGTHTYKERRRILNCLLKNEETNFLVRVPVLYEGTDHSKIHELLNVMDNSGKEGIMINRDVEYKFKRHNGIVKVKTMLSADLKIIGFEEGTGRLKHTLGAIIVDYKGTKVNVGSGFKDAERNLIWGNREKLLHTIAEIQYFEESQNEDGQISIRFPVFKTLRDDKTEVSYN